MIDLMDVRSQPWQEDSSYKVVGLNPIANEGFLLLNMSAEVLKNKLIFLFTNLNHPIGMNSNIIWIFHAWQKSSSFFI